jgi:membrane-bound lytic murein transglycosylase F
MQRRYGLRFLLVFLFFLALDCTYKPAAESFAHQPQVVLDLAAIQKRGYLTALIDNNSISYFIYKGRSMGYEYELLQYLAQYLKIELKIKVVTGIEEAIDQLNKGAGDILAFPLTITRERTEYVSFTNPHFDTYQVLVQKKPEGWRMQAPQITDLHLIRKPADLIGKEVFVMQGSSFKERLKNLSEEVGGEIKIREDSASSETESLIRKVAAGEIQYTVTDQTIAMVNALYYPDLDINTVLSLPQQIAWAVRKNSPELLNASNTWLSQTKKNGLFQVVYNKYFNSPRFSITLATSDYSSTAGNKLSPYDDVIKKNAELLNWDWRLLASVVYQESNFDPKVQSWAGAIGLMQVMPETGEFFSVSNLWEPGQNIKAGVHFLKFLDDQWMKTVSDRNERVKFVLASYNVGLSHVIDAQKLAIKYGKKPDVWENNVEYYLLQKSNPKYYRDAVAVAGYCRCDGPVIYVKEVLHRYDEYKIHFKLDS